VQVAPAMDRIVKAESAAMRMTLAALLTEIHAPAPSPIRAVADGFGGE